MPSCPPTEAGSNPRLETVLAAYLEAEESGRAPVRQEWLARYPELADDLQTFFDSREAVPRLWPERPILQTPCRFADYELLEEIAHGGMGIVYKARQLRPNRVVALKLILSGQLARRSDVERFRAEAEAAAGLDHPNIVPIYEVGEHDGQHYFTMKFIEGGSLGEVLRVESRESRAESGESRVEIGESRTEGGGLRVERSTPRSRLSTLDLGSRDSARLLAAVARAVHYAHQRGILHRDLKPSNILLEWRAGKGDRSNLCEAPGGPGGQIGPVPFSRPGPPIPYVTDFGLAKRVEWDDSQTISGAIVGTPLYMAPEQAAGQTRLTTAADVYSLGAILYWLLTDKPAIEAASPLEMLQQVQQQEPVRPRTLNPQLDRDLETICLKCLEKDPARRYGSAEALAEELERWLAGEAIEARPVNSIERAWRGCRRNPVVSALTAAVVMVAAVGLFGVLSQWQAAVANEQKAVTHAAAAQASAEKAKEKSQEASQQRDEARRQQAEAQRQRDEVQRQRDLLGARNEKLLATQQQLQSTLYAAHINLAQQAWDAGVVERVSQLLDQHRPKPGQADLRGFEWHYLNRLCHSNELTFEGHTAQVHSMALSPDAKRLATGSADHTVKVWDAQTGREMLTLKGHSRSVATVAFSPDGKRLASRSSEWDGQRKQQQPGEVKLWDAQTGRELVTLKDVSAISLLALSPDNKHLATDSSSDGTIKIWDTQTAREYLTLKGTDRPKDEWVAALAFSPDGKRLAAGIHNSDYSSENDKRLGGKVKLWDAGSGKELFTLKGHTRSVNSVLFSPDGKRLASGSMDATVKVWNPQTGQELLTLPGHTDYNWPPMAFSPDGRRLAVGCDSTVKLWDAQSGQELTTLKWLNAYARCLALSDDGRCLAGTVAFGSSYGTAASATATVRTWNTRKDREGLTFKIGSGHIDVLAYSPDGTRLAVVAGDGAKLLDASTGKETVALKGHSEEVSRLAFSPDGKRLATSSSDKTVKVWDTQTGQELVTKAHAKGATGLAFSPDGKRLASGSWDGNIKLWDTKSWTEVRTIATGGAIEDLAFTPDGKRLASASAGLVNIWEPETGRLALTLRASGSDLQVHHLAISPDGQRVAGGLRTLFIWDARTGRQLLTLDGHTCNVTQLAFSPDGKRLVSADYDRAVKLWDAQSGRELLSFPGGGAAAFSPDGRRVARGTGDGAVEIWDATPLPEKKPERVRPVTRQELAEGWSGAASDDYEKALDTTVRHGGRASVRIKSKVPAPTGFGGVAQTFRADDYRGKRLRLSGYVKTKDAEKGAWLWMGLGCETEYVLDKMHDRLITGTRDWKRYDIVLDVPKDAYNIRFGVSLTGAGQAWFDDLQFEIVGRDVPVTKSTTNNSLSRGSASDLPPKPVNLDFESQRPPGAALPPGREIAKGWRTPRGFELLDEVGLDSRVRHGGNRSAFVKARGPSGFANVLQAFRAGDYRGKRLRLSAYVKTESVEQGACLWMRVDCKSKSIIDNMHDRPVTGTRDWRIHEIVLDVPEDAINIFFGFLLTGAGQAWCDDFQFDIVSPDYLIPGSPTEGRPVAWQLEPASQAKPVNLGFEE